MPKSHPGPAYTISNARHGAPLRPPFPAAVNMPVQYQQASLEEHAQVAQVVGALRRQAHMGEIPRLRRRSAHLPRTKPRGSNAPSSTTMPAGKASIPPMCSGERPQRSTKPDPLPYLRRGLPRLPSTASNIEKDLRLVPQAGRPLETERGGGGPFRRNTPCSPSRTKGGGGPAGAPLRGRGWPETLSPTRVPAYSGVRSGNLQDRVQPARTVRDLPAPAAKAERWARCWSSGEDRAG